jgi:hypothetical protein
VQWRLALASPRDTIARPASKFRSAILLLDILFLKSASCLLDSLRARRHFAIATGLGRSPAS